MQATCEFVPAGAAGGWELHFELAGGGSSARYLVAEPGAVPLAVWRRLAAEEGAELPLQRAGRVVGQAHNRGGAISLYALPGGPHAGHVLHLAGVAPALEAALAAAVAAGCEFAPEPAGVPAGDAAEAKAPGPAP